MESINSYKKSERLKSKKAIEQLFTRGQCVNASGIKVFYHFVDFPGVRAGFAVPKRNIRLAVNRNLIKRRMRESYRLNNQALKLLVQKRMLGLEIMFVYNSQQILSYQEVEEKIKVILTRLTELGELVVE